MGSRKIKRQTDLAPAPERLQICNKMNYLGKPIFLGGYLFVFLAVFYIAMPYRGVDAVCCGNNFKCPNLSSWICGDASSPTTASQCCGRGACNIFCCNCGDGCRCNKAEGCKYYGRPCDQYSDGGIDHGNNGRRGRLWWSNVEVEDDLPLRGGRSIMKLADTDGDGMISVVEASDYLVADGKMHQSEAVASFRAGEDIAPEWFRSIDNDGDGLIAPGELDHDLA